MSGLHRRLLTTGTTANPQEPVLTIDSSLAPSSSSLLGATTLSVDGDTQSLSPNSLATSLILRRPSTNTLVSYLFLKIKTNSSIFNLKFKKKN